VIFAGFIAAQRTEFGVPHAKVCRLLGVSESWFYKWHNRPPIPRQVRRAEIDAAVAASFDASDGDYGSPRVLADLKEAGYRVSKKTVEASMARQGLVARPPRRRRKGLTRPDKAGEPLVDLLKREFGATEVDQRWCGGLTEIPTEEGKLYLAAVEDLCSRRVPGFAIGEHHDAPLAVEAINMAVAIRGGDVTGVVLHSDKGSEYNASDFRAACRAAGITQSMGRVGSALDNAPAESFFSTFEFECLRKGPFKTKAEARRAAAAFIDHYNRVGRHSSIAMISPMQFEAALAAKPSPEAEAA
jgi:putative transposase